jgi:hypothetical protein
VVAGQTSGRRRADVMTTLLGRRQVHGDRAGRRFAAVLAEQHLGASGAVTARPRRKSAVDVRGSSGHRFDLPMFSIERHLWPATADLA